MARALLVIVLVGAGAVALVFGLNLRTQLIALFDPGLSGMLTAIVVACSSEHQAQLHQYRLLATILLWGGSGALLLGLVIGCTGQLPAALDSAGRASNKEGKDGQDGQEGKGGKQRKGGAGRKQEADGKRGGNAQRAKDSAAKA
jgi:hypothetical protein